MSELYAEIEIVFTDAAKKIQDAKELLKNRKLARQVQDAADEWASDDLKIGKTVTFTISQEVEDEEEDDLAVEDIADYITTQILKPNDFKTAGYPKVRTNIKGDKVTIVYSQK